MKTRIISGIIGFILLFVTVITGGLTFDIFILLITMIGIYEFDKVIKNIDNLRPLTFINYVLAIGLFISTKTPIVSIELVIFIYTIFLLSSLVFRDDLRPHDVSITILGGLYVPFFLYHLLLLNGDILIWLVFITAFSTDTFAYFVGKKFGKRKLAPKLSPKKTIEGSIGGIVGTLIVTVLFAYFINNNNYIRFGVLSIIASIMSQIGDLTASRIKRIANIKDYGKIMPGHGGILDRFDSILFTAPIVYYYIVNFLK